jgi:hypothetical protein
MILDLRSDRCNIMIASINANVIALLLSFLLLIHYYPDNLSHTHHILTHLCLSRFHTVFLS